MDTNTTIKNILKFLKNAEKLKTELRHSWTSDKTRQESVAEHTWMSSLIAMLVMDKVDKEVDQLKVLKMIIIHDLVEVFAKDIPAHESSSRMDNKFENETIALEKLVFSLDETQAEEIISLWNEFEKKSSLEAKLAYAIDKFECLVEHDIADISTWDEGDYRYTFIEKQDTPFNYDAFMRALKNELDKWTFQKLTESNTLDKVPVENIKLFKKNQQSE